MKTLIKLQEVRSDEPTYVRPSAIISLHNPGDDSYTEVVLEDGRRLVVKDKLEHVLAAIGYDDRELI